MVYVELIIGSRNRVLMWLCALAFLLGARAVNAQQDYRHYHEQVLKVEDQIMLENFDSATVLYQGLFSDYEFVFQRDWWVGAQCAFISGEDELALKWLEFGMKAGLEWREIKDFSLFRPLKKIDYWKSLEKKKADYRREYETKLDSPPARKMEAMFRKDQALAFKSLFRFSENKRNKFAEEVFAIQSEKHLQEIQKIIDLVGVPGERMVGEPIWLSVMLSHHNGISQDYSEKDTLYLKMKPELLQAIQVGFLSPYVYGWVEDWYWSVLTQGAENAYGMLNAPDKAQQAEVNINRGRVGMRPWENEKRLNQVERKYGLNLKLTGDL
ncbi:hypothetical protein [Persicobacter diffluens]|uniref:Uncharacterized protein n=1 Tax=Persicobacter diffluens TaxID=981 RepID=A0AAN4VUV9_9BACT|nr:hypothetical protein PEDI_11210 [Persicobacter diffluens]